MLNIVSLMIGLVALGLAIFAFLPFLGWANWAIIPLAMVGLGLGFLSGKDAGRNLNLIVIVVGGSGSSWAAGFFKPPAPSPRLPARGGRYASPSSPPSSARPD